jgi:hypothetical protein
LMVFVLDRIASASKMKLFILFGVNFSHYIFEKYHDPPMARSIQCR